ncbi:MAG: Bax inhibitor-1 family protein [Actinomycetota bacterium]|nr:Bax inhibitor-1 family protein [Actinomycetota bacterium]
MTDAHASATATTTFPRTDHRAGISTPALLGQVLLLVAIALGFLALGTVLGQDLSLGAANAFFLAGLGMLLITSFGGDRFRVGALAVGWLYALALLIGLGVGPVIAHYAAHAPVGLGEAIGGTALTFVAMGALGLALSTDLAPWMRPLSLVVLGGAAVSIALLLVGVAANPVLSLVIYGASALLITVDLNYLRKHGTEDDAVMLATGVFVSIVNVFLSLLDLLGEG